MDDTTALTKILLTPLMHLGQIINRNGEKSTVLVEVNNIMNGLRLNPEKTLLHPDRDLADAQTIADILDDVVSIGYNLSPGDPVTLGDFKQALTRAAKIIRTDEGGAFHQNTIVQALALLGKLGQAAEPGTQAAGEHVTKAILSPGREWRI
jgi:hypothetical protein